MSGIPESIKSIRAGRHAACTVASFGEASEVTKWKCSVCTLENDIPLTSCIACESARPTAKRPRLEACLPPRIGPAAFLAALAATSVPSVAAMQHGLPQFLSPVPTGAGPGRLRILSWNTDGIYERGLAVERAAKCATLSVTAQPDVVLLQELVSPSLEVFRGTLGRAGYVEASPPRPIHASGEASYFCGIFVSRALEMSTPRRRSFGCGSGMGRELHSVRVQVPHPEGRAAATAATAAGDESASDGGRQWCEVLTSHFESCKTSQGLRVQQFLEMTDAMLQAQLPAIFAGDTNLRQDEATQPKYAKQAGQSGLARFNAAFRPKHAPALVDAFEACGAPEAEKYTWDCARNDNLQGFDGPYKPRMRFDRCWSTPLKGCVAVPGSFRLVGTSKFQIPPSTSLFPSDHFGVCCDFEFSLT